MEIKKFETYNYRGKSLDVIDRKSFLTEIFTSFEDTKLFGYDFEQIYYDLNKEVLYLNLHNKETNQYVTLKLDFSDLGIEIGTHDWNEETEEFEEFQPKRNLDTPLIKQLKAFKNDTTSYNV